MGKLVLVHFTPFPTNVSDCALFFSSNYLCQQFVFEDNSFYKKQRQLLRQPLWIRNSKNKNVKIAICTVLKKSLSYRNPVERVHSIANLGLMKKQTSKNLEKLMYNANFNDEIRRLCDANEYLRKELVKSLDQPKKEFWSMYLNHLL